jgi:hypothetical protein
VLETVGVCFDQGLGKSGSVWFKLGSDDNIVELERNVRLTIVSERGIDVLS